MKCVAYYMQRNLEKLEADLQAKDSKLSTVTKERNLLQSTVTTGEKAATSQQVIVCVFVCV